MAPPDQPHQNRAKGNGGSEDAQGVRPAVAQQAPAGLRRNVTGYG
jgi:hypothetical protein